MRHPRASRGRGGRALLALVIGLALGQSAQADPIKATALKGTGSIAFDQEGIPLIRASNDNDAAFLQGYSHADSRFFQMDITRRAVSGTLAELVGSSVLGDDVQARTIGLRRAAWLSWQSMSDDTRGWLAAYSEGVNFWLSTHTLPPEYQALELTHADPWTPVDSICVGKGLAFQLSFDLDIDATIAFGAYQQAGAAAGFDPAALYFGDTHRIAPADSRVTIPDFHPGASGAALRTVGNADPLALGYASANIQKIDDETIKLALGVRDKFSGHSLFQHAFDRREALIGSNEWVVGGAHTASGKPILSNDPHLGLDLPPVFMEQHIVSSEQRGGIGLDATGVTVPGTPGIIQGCNQRVCWGTTTNSLDVTDVFKETFRVNTYGLPTAIVHNGVDEPVEWVYQSFYVNKLGDGTANNLVRENSIGYTNGGITIVIPRRNGGPVLNITGSTGLSVAYAGFGPTKELESFRRINRAANLEQFQDALTYFDFGSQNFAYADVDGNIAYFTSGEAPIRTDLQTSNAPGGGVPPWFIRDGSGALKHDWLPVAHPQPNQSMPYEILPASEMPHVINPASGYFANANNDPIGFSLDNNALNQVRPGGGIYYLDVGGASAYRVGRIDRELNRLFTATNNKITVADMKKLQSNNQLLDAELTLPYLLAAYDNAKASGAWSQLSTLASDARVTEAITRLRAWDYSTPTGIQQGYDPGDNPAALPTPSQAEADASVAASVFGMWRGFVVRNTISATLTKVGLQNYQPGSRDAQAGLKFMLDNFDALGGKGASGLNFFAVTGAPDAHSARDYTLLKSLKDGLDQLGSAALAPAFGGSANLADYRWGKLHRIVFDHPLGSQAPVFNLPGPNPYGFSDVSADLKGVARSGGFETVDAASHSTTATGLNDFMFGSGPARRFVGEMSSAISASEIIPGGQSGVLGSPLYASQLSRWLTNNYHALPISAASAAQVSGSQVDFEP